MLIKALWMPPLPKDRHRWVAITWTVTQDGWEGSGRAPAWQGSALQIISKSTAEKHCQCNSGALVLTCVLASSPDAQHVRRKYREPESKGSCTAVQESVCATVQAWGWWGRAQGRGSLRQGAPTPHVFHFFLHDSSQTSPVCRARKIPELNTDRVICKVTKKNKNQKRM